MMEQRSDRKEPWESKEAKEDLPTILQQIEQEARIVLPGIQALFGFQLVVVFSPLFSSTLTPLQKHLHLISITLVLLSIILALTPVAYHRQVEPESVSSAFIKLANRYLLWTLMPLMVGMLIDFYIVCEAISGDFTVSISISAVMSCLNILLWFILPQKRHRRG